MKFNKENLPKLITQAERHSACTSDINLLKTLSYDEIINHERMPNWAYWYAYNVKKGRWKSGERYIAQNAKLSYLYSALINKRFKKGENILATDNIFAFDYARHWKGRFKLAEKTLAKHPYEAYWYSVVVLNKRFKKSEAMLKKHEIWWTRYVKHFNLGDKYG